MDRFVSTFTNRLDAKGRVSIPAPFRAILERQSERQSAAGAAATAPIRGGPGQSAIYCYPALDAAALDAGGESLAATIDGLLAGLPHYSDERDELSVALYGEVQWLTIDGDGRVMLSESLRQHAEISSQVTFVGLGHKFQIWSPERFEIRRTQAREKVKEHRKLLGLDQAAARAAGGPVRDEAPSEL